MSESGSWSFGNTWNAKLEMWVKKDHPKQRTIFPNKFQACKTLDNHMSKQKAWHAKSGPNSTQGFSLICSMLEITTSSDAPNQGRPYMQQIIMTWVCASQSVNYNHYKSFPEDKHHTGKIDESLLWINLMNPTCWAWLLDQVLLHVQEEGRNTLCHQSCILWINPKQKVAKMQFVVG